MGQSFPYCKNMVQRYSSSGDSFSSPSQDNKNTSSANSTPNANNKSSSEWHQLYSNTLWTLRSIFTWNQGSFASHFKRNRLYNGTTTSNRRRKTPLFVEARKGHSSHTTTQRDMSNQLHHHTANPISTMISNDDPQHLPYSNFFYQYAQTTGSTIQEKRDNLKNWLHEFGNFDQLLVETMERHEMMSMTGGRSSSSHAALQQQHHHRIQRGLHLYLIFRMALSTQEVGITRSIWNQIVPIISKVLPPEGLDEFHDFLRHNYVLSRLSSVTGGLPLLRRLLVHGFMENNSEDCISFMSTAFELQDSAVLDLFYNVYFSQHILNRARVQDVNPRVPVEEKNLLTNSTPTAIAHETTPSSIRDLEIYMYVLGQVKMIHSKHGYKNVLHLWEQLVQNARTSTQLLSNRLLADIAPFVVEACCNAKVEHSVAQKILQSIFEQLQERNLPPSAEMVGLLLKNQHLMENSSQRLFSHAWFSFEKLAKAAAKRAQGGTPFPASVQQSLEQFVCDTVSSKFPLVAFRSMDQENRAIWMTNTILNESDPAQLPHLLKLYSWIQLIYGDAPSAKVYATFTERTQQLRVSSSLRLRFLFALKSTLGKASMGELMNGPIVSMDGAML